MAPQLNVGDMALPYEPGEIVSLRPGEFLFYEGDEAEAMYIVRQGTLRVVGGETVYETLRPGSIVGEMAIVDAGRRSASVITGTYAELLRIDEAKFLSLVATVPSFALVVMQVMARRLRMMNKRHRTKSSAGVTPRYS
jgi:CRP/FNR family transcriptional regulator, cyclic AMP receptor protein